MFCVVSESSFTGIQRQFSIKYLSEKQKLPGILAIKGVGRPARLLPHAKMLLTCIPIELFLSAGQIMLWKVPHLY